MLGTFPEEMQLTDAVQAPGNWAKALTLVERAATLTDETDAHSHEPGEARCKKLQLWKEQPPFGDGQLFETRLKFDALSEQKLSLLMSESTSALQSRLDGIPLWARTAAESLNSFNPGEDTDTRLLEPLANVHGAVFLKLVFPLLKPELKRLQSGARALLHGHDAARHAFRSEDILQLFLPNLIPHLLPRLSRTVALEVNVARMRGDLQGDSPEQRFSDFLEQMSRPEKLRALLMEYPVLSRQLVLAITTWVDAELEVLQRLCADWHEICQTFVDGAHPGPLVGATGELGDSHAGGRTVHCLKFSSGLQLIYKPKPLAVDLHFQELLAWINEKQHLPEFRVLTILDRGNYGWTEFVHSGDCASLPELERFYERQGCYLALLYALEATDFHCENLIAAGEHPVLIDLEALFHPRIESYHYEDSPDPAVVAIGDSVLRVGLLPEHMAGEDQAGMVDVSGLGGGKPGGFSRPVPAWEGFGTDTMSVVRKSIRLAGADNLPKLLGADVQASDHAGALVRGFQRMYEFLRDRAEELWNGPLQKFRNDRVRIVFRATKMYTNILRNSYHPDLLRDALERDRFLDSLWAAVKQQPYLARLIAAERADLQSGDIPIFTCYVDSRDVQTSQHATIPELLKETSLDSVKKRFAKLSQQDLQQQLWLIRASLAAGVLGDPHSAWRSSDLQPSESAATRSMLMKEARAVGERLLELATFEQDRANWVMLTMEGDRNWQISPAKSDLYGGTSGVVLFLAYLAAISGEKRYEDVARAGLRSIRQQIKKSWEDGDAVNVGAFSGLGSPIYLLSHLGHLWNDPELLREADSLVDVLPSLISIDDAFDIVTGSAGCISSLLALHSVSGSASALDAALRCGQHLIANAQPSDRGLGWVYAPASSVPLTGFSHGAAGIGLSLMRLSHASGDASFGHVAQAAIEYERSVFSPERGNWPDFRDVAVADSADAASSTAASYSVAWCHGAAGIGMARLGCLRAGADPDVEREIEAALSITRSEGFGMNHSLCHGDLGNLELLLLAAQELRRPDLQDECYRIAAEVVRSISRRGWCTGLPLGFESPGLMTGIAGIGYQLLRLAHPDRVPSVLILEPPAKRI